MRTWKIVWLSIMLVILSGGIIFTFSNREKPVERTIVSLPTPTETESKRKIAVMADVHNDAEELKTMLNIAKNDNVEMVVIAGDLTNSGKISELTKMKSVLDESKLKYEVVPGNHEVSLENFKKFFPDNYKSVRMGEIKLILVDNSYWQGLGAVQKEWLKNEVSECRVLVCVAIMHKPINNPLSTHIMGENNKLVAAEAEWLRELLVNSGVRQIEAGHLHYASSYFLGDIRTDIVGAVSRERNNESPRYTELMIGKNSIDRKVVEETNDIGN